MKLKNNFSEDTRNLFLYHQYCQNCMSNNMPSIHHIAGRLSDSPLNAVVLCHDCHAKCGHSEEEETKYFKIAHTFHTRNDYQVTEEDKTFINNYPRLKNALFPYTSKS